MLTKEDLYSDHLLIRRVKRLENSGNNRASASNSDSDSDDIKIAANNSGPKGSQSLEEFEDDHQHESNVNEFGEDIDGFAEDDE